MKNASATVAAMSSTMLKRDADEEGGGGDGGGEGGDGGRGSSAALMPVFSSTASAEKGRRMLKAVFAKGAAEAAECAICHDHIATALNLPCLHKFLCWDCSERFRADEGDVCFSCREPSTVVETLVKRDKHTVRTEVRTEWSQY